MSTLIPHQTRWKTKITGIFFVLLMITSGNGWAEDQKRNNETLKTRDIVITPTRTEREVEKVPSSVSVISEDDLKRSEATTVADALQDVPGIEVFDLSVPGAKRVQIRGESGSRVLVLIDGQKISEQKSMDGAALLIDPNRIERIEVIKGPASVLYGSEAIGGVINIITKKGGTKPIQAELNASYDSSVEGIDGYASAYGGHGRFSYRLSGAWTDYGDRRTPEGTLENSSYEIQDYSAFLGYDHDNLSIGATYDNYQSDVNSHTPEGTTDDTLTYFQLDLPQWDREKVGGYVELRDLADSLTRMRLDAYYQNTRKVFKNDMDLNIPMGPMGNMLIENRITTDNDQDSFGGNFQIDWVPHQNHYVIFGYEPIFDRLDAATEIRSLTDSPVPPPFGTQTTDVDNFTYDAEMDTHAAYIQDEWSLPANFTATLGFRQTWVRSELKDTNNPSLEKERSDDNHPVFSAGLIYDGVDHLVLRGLFSQGYRFPNLQQLFIGTVHGSADPTFPNPDLQPETSNNYEIGARFHGQAFAVDLAGFFSDAKDYITTAPVTGGRQFTNVEKAETYGAELTLSYTFSDWGLTPYASRTWLRRKFTRDDFSTYDTGQPELWGRAGLRYERLVIQRIDFFSDLYARWATEAREEFSDGTKETYGSWETLNLTLGARFGHQKQYFATLNLNNLFDRSYSTAQSSIDQPGFHAVIKAGVAF
jgi:hemoglobin/transferrin/lactoferrin receptor protein